MISVHCCSLEITSDDKDLLDGCVDAFLYVVVEASDIEEAIRRIKYEMNKLKYNIIDFHFYHKYEEMEWEEKDKKYFDDLASQAKGRAEIIFSELYGYCI